MLVSVSTYIFPFARTAHVRGALQCARRFRFSSERDRSDNLPYAAYVKTVSSELIGKGQHP